jgi:hypothetical protein
MSDNTMWPLIRSLGYVGGRQGSSSAAPFDLMDRELSDVFGANFLLF